MRKYKKKYFDKLYKLKNVLKFKKSISFKELIIQIYSIIFFNSKHLKEELKSYGNKNTEKTFYIIRRSPPGAGLLSNYLLVLMHVYYAKKMGYEPIVDYKNYSNFYKEKGQINNSDNSWEYYFQQPTNTSLEDVYKSKNVILSSANISRELKNKFSISDINEGDLINEVKVISEFSFEAK